MQSYMYGMGVLISPSACLFDVYIGPTLFSALVSILRKNVIYSGYSEV